MGCYGLLHSYYNSLETDLTILRLCTFNVIREAKTFLNCKTKK